MIDEKSPIDLCGFDLASLYSRFGAELRELSRALRRKMSDFHRDLSPIAFGDIEGEILYLLIRELRPTTVFEISPNAGWSTNYILAALTKNAHGTLHTFELMESMNGQPMEKLIRANQLESLDQARLKVYIGDALKTTETVPGPIDFLLLDSCHDEWFAKWYVEKLLPRCKGIVMVQDIAFIDHLERSTEASFFWKWMEERGLQPALLGVAERALLRNPVRADLPDRRAMRSNAVLFRWPDYARGGVPSLAKPLDELIMRISATIKTGRKSEALADLDALFHRLSQETDRGGRHRELIRMGRLYSAAGDRSGADRCFGEALAIAVREFRVQRKKSLPDVLLELLVAGSFRWSAAAGLLVVVHPNAWVPAIKRLTELPRRVGAAVIKGR